jgi:MoxR-like ATPase
VTSSLESAQRNVRAAVIEASSGLVQRESLVELVVLCAVVSEHLLVIGPPGTAKSEAVRRIARRLGGRYFEYLVGRFTEPTEIFGPIDLRRLKEGVVETETRGMLPEADVAFLDEIFLGSTAILNTLLTILNERSFRRGHTSITCPLRVCVAAANRLPDEAELAAFADRFLVRTFVEPIADSGLEELLAAGWSLARNTDLAVSSMADLELLSRAALAMDLTRLRPAIAQAVRLLRGAGIELTDRRIVRAQRLVAGAALLAGRHEASEADLWPLLFTLPTEQAQQLGRDVLKEHLAASENALLLSAAAESSLGPKARGAKLVRDGTAVLEGEPAEHAKKHEWRLRVEAIAREIDATFAREALPEELAALRTRIVALLAPDPSARTA